MPELMRRSNSQFQVTTPIKETASRAVSVQPKTLQSDQAALASLFTTIGHETVAEGSQSPEYRSSRRTSGTL
jgi:hypothetical protein